MSGPILIETIVGTIAIVTLNQPELRNPITDWEVVDTLVTTLERLDRNPDVNAIILTGAGKAFSTGGNLKAMVAGEGPQGPDAFATIRNYRNGIQRIPLAIADLEVPLIAAVNGAAIGAGCDLACMCDMRIASRNAMFAESFVKLGLVPGDGGAWLLRRIVGESKAMELSLTGDSVDAAEALRIGLVSQVVEPDQLMEAALALAGRIAANPSTVVRSTKRLIRLARDGDLRATLEASAALQAAAHEFTRPPGGA